MYRAKGSEKAVNLLFRILYDDDVTFQYPGELILRASDGKWQIDTVLRTYGTDTLFTLENQTITGVTSGAESIIESVLKVVESGATVYQLFLGATTGVFQNGETFNNGSVSGVVNSVTLNPGRWIGTDGQLSSDKVLQDNVFYQEYSYVLKTQQFIDRYRDVVKKLTHPAGVALFGQVDIVDVLELPLVSANSEFSLSVEANNSQLSTVVTSSSFSSFENQEEFEPNSLDATFSTTQEIFAYGPVIQNGVAILSTNTHISTWESTPIFDLDAVRIGSIGLGRILEGTEANANFETKFTVGEHIMIRDTLEVNDDQLFGVIGIANNMIMDLSHTYTGTLARWDGDVYDRSASLSIDFGAITTPAGANTGGYSSITVAASTFIDYGSL
jgi:hypothetical protein